MGYQWLGIKFWSQQWRVLLIYAARPMFPMLPKIAEGTEPATQTQRHPEELYMRHKELLKIIKLIMLLIFSFPKYSQDIPMSQYI